MKKIDLLNKKFVILYCLLCTFCMVGYVWTQPIATLKARPGDNGLGALFFVAFSVYFQLFASVIVLFLIPLKFSVTALGFAGLSKIFLRRRSFNQMFSLAIYASTPLVIASTFINWWMCLTVSVVLYLYLLVKTTQPTITKSI